MSSDDRPLLTIALFAYNQRLFVEEAARAVLNQTYSPLEVVLSDDCSSDGTFEILQEIVAGYRGSHRLILNRNERNLGLVGHINNVMSFAKGELLIAAAGDDVSVPERTEQLFLAYLESGKKAHSLYSRAVRIDSMGQLLGDEPLTHDPHRYELGFMAQHQVSVPGSTQAWSRKVFEVFGPIDERLISEDIVIPFRAALLGDVRLVDKALVYRRHHQSNMWLHPQRSSRTGVKRWHREQFSSRLRNLRVAWDSKLADLEIVLEVFPARHRELAGLDHALRMRLMDIEMEEAFVHARYPCRLAIGFKAIKAQVPISRLARWIFQYSFPATYYRLVQKFSELVS